LTQTNEELQSTLQTLQSELVQSNDESEKLTKQLEVARGRIQEYEQSARDSVIRDRELRELREEAEGLRLDKEELEMSLQRERLQSASGEEVIAELRKELESERVARIWLEDALKKETEKSENLQGVLEDFQAGGYSRTCCPFDSTIQFLTGKDMELQSAIQETQARLESITLSLAEYKHRALQAEVR
jgi:chromosome segregation ATPase